MEKIFDITQVQVGHLIGRGGMTIKGLQDRTGAKFEIIEGPRVRITGDSEEKVVAAVEEVQMIIADQEHPDYEGAVGARLRKKADALAAKRAELLDKATAKRNAGYVDAANKLVEEAKEAGRRMDEKNKAAAAAIAEHNNEAKGKGDDYFDMHGLRKEEAMTMLQSCVERLKAKPNGTVTELQLIPGAGHHSAPGKQALKAATEAYLNAEGIPFKAVSAGSLMASVIGTGEAAAAAAMKEDKEKIKCSSLCAVM
ncbi:hypothetical protein TraAM80_05341 [Trypanosoma rangeli]|uniref:Smr domain-containing protein n=1 Tax=Trypanosoma rangeli TaxID=5698 RepID=A0A422NF86_TRYRA|nr:uncharacterized protein TraAM80_05341 [Trypanosoma rangeli]RNF04106.1 hypothetical protein TraAM80_05341 [Trypanosoma rangeli]|eukprot:RNF04106.1 hypothetical protein TraAM80_05341 [Trypanosoma rangeli]